MYEYVCIIMIWLLVKSGSILMPGSSDKGNKFESHLKLYLCIEFPQSRIAIIVYLIIFFSFKWK